MNKFGFAAIALVVASACVISAAPNGHEGKLSHHGHEGKLSHHGHGHKHLAKQHTAVGPVVEREREREEFEVSHHEPSHHGSKHHHHEPIPHHEQIQHHGHQCHCPEYQHEHDQSFDVPKHFNKHLHGGSHSGIRSGHQSGSHSGSHLGDHSGSHSGAHSGGHSGSHSGSHSGGHSGSHSGHHSGGHSGHHSGSQSGRSGSGSFSGELERNRGAVRTHDEEREHIHAENNRFGQKLGAKGLIAGRVDKDHHEDTGIKKHQKVNTDKTIIVDKGTAVNDIEVNRHTHDHKGVGGFAAGALAAKSEASSGRLDADREHDRDVEAHGSQFRESESHDF